MKEQNIFPNSELLVLLCRLKSLEKETMKFLTRWMEGSLSINGTPHLRLGLSPDSTVPDLVSHIS